jgi:hypothetical protein
MTDLSSRYGPQLRQLKAIFPSWDEGDLAFTLQDVKGNVDEAAMMITEGKSNSQCTRSSLPVLFVSSLAVSNHTRLYVSTLQAEQPNSLKQPQKRRPQKHQARTPLRSTRTVMPIPVDGRTLVEKDLPDEEVEVVLEGAVVAEADVVGVRPTAMNNVIEELTDRTRSRRSWWTRRYSRWTRWIHRFQRCRPHYRDHGYNYRWLGCPSRRSYFRTEWTRRPRSRIFNSSCRRWKGRRFRSCWRMGRCTFCKGIPEGCQVWKCGMGRKRKTGSVADQYGSSCSRSCSYWTTKVDLGSDRQVSLMLLSTRRKLANMQARRQTQARTRTCR